MYISRMMGSYKGNGGRVRGYVKKHDIAEGPGFGRTDVSLRMT